MSMSVDNDRKCFVPTPGSFISDCFFFDELSKICGQDKAQLWLTAQLNARSFCTTATPGTPQNTSAPTSPRIKQVVLERPAETHFIPNLRTFSEQSKSFSMGLAGTQNWGVAVNADGASNFRSRFHSFSHSRKNEQKSNNNSWKHWKSYADGHAKAPKPAAFTSMCPSLPQHQEQSESPSDSSDNCDTSERPAFDDDSGSNDTEAANMPSDANPSAESHPTPAAQSTYPTDTPDTLRGGAAGPTSMQLMQRLVKERGAGGGEAASSIGLLFTDAAHTVLDRC